MEDEKKPDLVNKKRRQSELPFQTTLKTLRRAAGKIKRGGVYVALVFSQSISGGKIVPPVRKSPGKS